MTDPVAEGGHFRGVYSVGDALDAPTHELTPPRDTIEEVVADLLEAQARRRIIYFAQIINTATLHPIEPARATIERLRQADTRGNAGSRNPSSLSSSMGLESSVTAQSFGYLLLAMAVICIGTVVGVLIVP
jgi:hypothetical protein